MDDLAVPRYHPCFPIWSGHLASDGINTIGPPWQRWARSSESTWRRPSVGRSVRSEAREGFSEAATASALTGGPTQGQNLSDSLCRACLVLVSVSAFEYSSPSGRIVCTRPFGTKQLS